MYIQRANPIIPWADEAQLVEKRGTEATGVEG